MNPHSATFLERATAFASSLCFIAGISACGSSSQSSPSTTGTNDTESMRRVPAIEYHEPTFSMSGLGMKPEWFEVQIRWLYENGFKTLSASEFVSFLDGTADETVVPQRSVVLRFDIGSPKREEMKTSVLPLLRQYRFRGVWFLQTKDIVVVDACDDPGGRYCWTELRQWYDEGLIDIGSHSVSHVDSKDLSSNAMRWEARKSKEILESKLSEGTSAFQVIGWAYPYDSAPPEAQSIVRAVGYEFGLCGNERNPRAAVFKEPARFNIPSVYPYSTDEHFPDLYYKPYETKDWTTLGEYVCVLVGIPPGECELDSPVGEGGAAGASGTGGAGGSADIPDPDGGT